MVDVWSMKMWSMSGGGQRRVQSPKLIDVQVSLGNQIDTTQANVRDTFRISCSAVKDSPRKEIIIWSPDTERRLEHLWNNPRAKQVSSNYSNSFGNYSSSSSSNCSNSSSSSKCGNSSSNCNNSSNRNNSSSSSNCSNSSSRSIVVSKSLSGVRIFSASPYTLLLLNPKRSIVNYCVKH